jgi:hypothetical protein
MKSARSNCRFSIPDISTQFNLTRGLFNKDMNKCPETIKSQLLAIAKVVAG